MKNAKIIIVAVMLALLAAGYAYAAPDTATQTLTINATINAKAQLSLNTASIAFNDSSWNGTDATIPSSPETVGITAKVKTGSASTATLTCKASADFDTAVPVSAVKWTSSSSNYAASGTMSKSSDVSVASRTGSGDLNGTVTPTMDTSWNYPTGAYSVTATYTLTAP